ncbi:unnamed protein product [Spirodela intermedia]|uniref:Uncharacterized protein n=1 Tax=Spirodela intermedia TaxID=51605 RepID=A0A7I8LC25_SPIIN|nr:unnamed protein product [Spirodela intermedia]
MQELILQLPNFNLLAEYNFTLKYKLRWTNIVTNILSCQGAIVEAIALSTSIGDLSDEIQVAHNTDPTIKQLIQQIESGETCQF